MTGSIHILPLWPHGLLLFYLYNLTQPHSLKGNQFLSLFKLLCEVGLGLGGSVAKNPPINAGDAGLIPRLDRSPRKENGNSIQYSCLENPMDRGAWWAAVHGVAKSQTWLNNWEYIHTHEVGHTTLMFLDDDSLWLMLDRPTYMYQSNYTTKLNSRLLTWGVWNIWIFPLKYKILLICYHINAAVFWLWTVILPTCQFFSGWLCYISFIFLTLSGHFILFRLFLCP